MDLKYAELEKLFYDITEIVSYMESAKYKNRRFKLYLGNGDQINLCLKEEHIPHLLGININYLSSLGLTNEKNSFRLLKWMIDNTYKIFTLKEDKKLSFEQLFSSYIQQKVESFEQNIKLDLYEVETICKYNPIRTYHLTDKNEKYDYIIIKKYKDGKIGLLGLVKNNDGLYAIMSNQIYDDYESAKKALSDLLSNQEITIINGITTTNSVDDYNSKYHIPISAKAAKVSELKKYRNDFSCIIDVSADFIYSLNETQKHMNDHADDMNLIEKIVTSIENGDIVNPEEFKDSKLIKLIEAYNNFRCNPNGSTQGNVKETYTNLKQELENLKQELKEEKAKKSEAENNVCELQKINQSLTEENDKLKKQKEKILKIYNE